MRTITVPCLRDNYAYLIANDDHQALVVDPSEGPPVERALQDNGLSLSGIVATHHHWDHTGGIAALLGNRSGLPVFAHATDAEKFDGTTQTIAEGKHNLAGFEVDVVENPGHTLGAISIMVQHPGVPHVFTGDTLFIGGCGRMFEGTPEAMSQSLFHLSQRAKDAKIFCGHEYTEANFEFATWLQNDDITSARASWSAATRQAGETTMGVDMAVDVATNPFLRIFDPAYCASLAENSALMSHIGGTPPPPEDSVAWFATLRNTKDNFPFR